MEPMYRTRWALPYRLLPALALVAALPGRGEALTYRFETPIAGDPVPVTLRIEAPASGRVAIDVSIPPGAGDLLGLFGNVVDEGLLAHMRVQGSAGDVTQARFQADAVWKVGTGNTMAPVKDWDWGAPTPLPQPARRIPSRLLRPA